MTDTDCRFLARRRALNMVWTAAGEYGFDPVFLAFTQDGLPDFYLNSIIGYVQKWYDRDTMNRLFDTIGNTVLKETLDGLLWIGLENCSFLREVRERPVLSEMRRVCAKSFFNQQLTKSRQQWMSQNSLVYALQSARWRTVLGKEPGLINPWEKKLFEELAFREAWDADQITSHATDIFRRYFRLGQSSLPLSLFAKFRGKAGSLIKKGLPHRVIRAEDLIFTSDSAGNGIITPRKARTFGPISALQEENDRLYIESCFGFPLFGYDENARAEEAFCTGHITGNAICILHPASAPRIQGTILLSGGWFAARRCRRAGTVLTIRTNSISIRIVLQDLRNRYAMPCLYIRSPPSYEAVPAPLPQQRSGGLSGWTMNGSSPRHSKRNSLISPWILCWTHLLPGSRIRKS